MGGRKAVLRQGAQYATFLSFFQEEITKKDWKRVVHEYLLKGDAAADDMLARSFAGFLHPLIQLMYGVEWEQPTIVAEALSQTAVHGDEGLKDLLLEAEAKAIEAQAQGRRMPAIMDLYQAVRDNEALSSCVTMEMESKIREGVLGTDESRLALLELMSRVKVAPEEVLERSAEMFDGSLFVAASAAAHPLKYPKFDFFLMYADYPRFSSPPLSRPRDVLIAVVQTPRKREPALLKAQQSGLDLGRDQS